MLAIGSLALIKYFDRKVNDIDIIVNRSKINDLFKNNDWKFFTPIKQNKYLARNNDFVLHEFFLENYLNNSKLLSKEFYSGNSINLLGNDIIIPTLEALYILKRSHAHINLKKWNTHIEDMIKIKKMIEPLSSKNMDILNERIQLTTDFFNRKRVNLNKSKDDFFTEAVKRYIEHDELHFTMSLYETPLYIELLSDNKEVFISKEKFFKQSKELQIGTALEEVAVIAMERFLIPRIKELLPNVKIPNLSPDKLLTFEKFLDDWIIAHYPGSHKLALQGLITRMTQGWFNNFLIDNYEEIANHEKFLVNARRAILRVMR